MTIGERVLELIHEKGMTQKAFSELTGIPQSTMSSWKGKKQNPGMEKLQGICDVLKVDPYFLISGTKMRDSLNTDYTIVYRNNQEEYEIVEGFRKLNRDNRQRLLGYVKALEELERENNNSN